MKRAQSTAEYAVLLAVITAAILAMQVYFKRGVQGRIRNLADQISTQQYEAKETESYYNIEQSGTTVQHYKDGRSEVYQDGQHGSVLEEIKRSGYEKTNPTVE